MTYAKNTPAPSITELQIIQQGENLLISAQLLHKKLKSGYQFSDWIKRRIKEYGFTDNLDFFVSKKSEAKKGRGGHNATDYLLTLDTAKELAMLERNEIGRAIRRYFIQKEKEARGIVYLPKEDEIFKGLKSKIINGRKMYPFRQFLVQIGYSSKSRGCHYRRSYSNHFVQLDNVWLLTEELALMIFHSRRLIMARKVNKQAQPVLPFYGEQNTLPTAQK